MNDITKPDFGRIAYLLIHVGSTPQCNSLEERITLALKQVYEQGYQLGVNKGWALEQDKDNA